MDREKIKQCLAKGALRCIPEHAKDMESNLSWAKHFKAESADSQIQHEQKWATHHMDAINYSRKYLNGQMPDAIAAIITKAEATYNEIMNINK